MKPIDPGHYLGAAITTIYTVLIYVSNTPSGTPAQVSFVAWYSVVSFVMAVIMCFATDEVIIDRKARVKRSSAMSAWFTSHALLQILLLAVTAHFWLMTCRLLAFLMIRARITLANERANQKASVGG